MKDSPSDVVADSQETPETVAEELKAEQVTPEHVLKRLSRAIRVPGRYVSSLHHRLLTDEGGTRAP